MTNRVDQIFVLAGAGWLMVYVLCLTGYTGLHVHKHWIQSNGALTAWFYIFDLLSDFWQPVCFSTHVQVKHTDKNTIAGLMGSKPDSGIDGGSVCVCA